MTHRAFTPSRQVAVVEPGDDSSAGIDFGVAVGAGLITTALGGALGYQFSKRSRLNERRQEEAAGLRDELNGLKSELDQLVAKTRTGTAEGDDSLAVRRRAVQLGSNVPPWSACREQATSALYGLIETLAEPSSKLGPDADADSLSLAGKEIETSFRPLIIEVEKGSK